MKSTSEVLGSTGPLSCLIHLVQPSSSLLPLRACGMARSEDTVNNCSGVYRVGNRIFRCNSRYGNGSVTTDHSIAISCNVFYYAEGLRMGIDVLSAEAERFGLAEKTGLEIAFETSRIVVPTKEWKRERIGVGWVPGDTANTSIGQGFLLVTPLQMASVMASIARKETRTKPTLRALSRAEAAAVNHGGEPIGLNDWQQAQLSRDWRRSLVQKALVD